MPALKCSHQRLRDPPDLVIVTKIDTVVAETQHVATVDCGFKQGMGRQSLQATYLDARAGIEIELAPRERIDGLEVKRLQMFQAVKEGGLATAAIGRRDTPQGQIARGRSNELIALGVGADVQDPDGVPRGLRRSVVWCYRSSRATESAEAPDPGYPRRSYFSLRRSPLPRADPVAQEAPLPRAPYGP